MKDKANFLKSLSVLATACKYQLTEEVIQVYDRALSTIGYGNAERAIVKAFMIRRSNDPMPSVFDLVRFASGKTSDEAMASELSDKIWDAVARFGAYSENQAKEFVGTIGAKVINRVGWSFLCQAQLSDAPVIRAQLRGTAKSLLESDRFEVVNKILEIEANGQKAIEGISRTTEEKNIIRS